MRKQFSDFLFEEMKSNDKIFLLTGDLGYGVLDKIRDAFPTRFKNVGCREQLMIGIAIGLSYEGFIPICYSITPFTLYRPFEMIRNYVHYESVPIKLVGTGRDRDYLTLGNTHWAEDDLDVLKSLGNIKAMKPIQITREIVKDFLYSDKPCYLNLQR